MRFGPFELDLTSHRLRQGEADLHLTPKAFELLALLVDAAPRVVPKQEIHTALWPTHAVTDATLVGLIKEIRRVLGDNDPDRPVIRTAHRVGYAVNVPVERGADAQPMAGALMIGDKPEVLAQGDNVVGRDPECEVWIDSATVSRRHARIHLAGETAALEDLGSKNGTLLGGRPLTERTELRDGDQIWFGGIAAIFRDFRSTPATATATHFNLDEE